MLRRKKNLGLKPIGKRPISFVTAEVIRSMEVWETPWTCDKWKWNPPKKNTWTWYSHGDNGSYFHIYHSNVNVMFIRRVRNFLPRIILPISRKRVAKKGEYIVAEAGEKCDCNNNKKVQKSMFVAWHHRKYNFSPITQIIIIYITFNMT